VIRADFSSHESLTRALAGQDVVVNAVTAAAGDTQKALIDAAIAAGVKRFVPSEFGSGTLDARARALVPMFEAKREVNEYLRAREGSIEWTGIFTGPFFDWAVRNGFMGFDPAKRTVTVFDEGTTVFSATNLHQVGETLVKILERPEETRNRFVTVSGFQTTQMEMLAVAEKITGEKWSVTHVDVQQHVLEGNEKLKKGDFMGMMNQLQGLSFGKQALGNIEDEGLWNERLGLSQDSMEDSLRAAFEGKLLHEE
jgi:uncharacterized protein YbjT (DUF2867 family)